MKLEIGKFYRNKDGRKLIFLGVDLNGDYPFAEYNDKGFHIGSIWYTKKAAEKFPEWVDLRKLDIYVEVLEFRGKIIPYAYISEEQLLHSIEHSKNLRNPQAKTLATFKCTVTEGERCDVY